VAVVILASVAYAAFTQLLTVSGTGTAAGAWNVKITSITRTGATGATETVGTPSFTDTTATFDTALAYPGATATYDIVVTNAGSIPAVLSSITDLTATNAAAPTYITYTVSGVTADTTTLAAASTNTVTVTVTWDAASAPTTVGENKALTLDLNYDQDT
jgi:uncharacterized repeat protein (TIGR01451 family)